METTKQTNNKQKLSLTIECERTLKSFIEVDLDVNEKQKQVIQNLLKNNDWDDVVELLNVEHDIDVHYPQREWVFDDECIYFNLDEMYINQIN